MSRIKGLLSDSVIYGLSGVITRFISIFLIPLYTKVFTPEDYGRMGLLSNGVALISIITVMALDNATARWFYDTNDEADKRRSINTWLWFYLLLSVVATLTLCILSGYINQKLLNNYPKGIYCICLLAGTLPTSALIAVANNVLRFERKAIPTVILSLLGTFISIGLNVVLVLWLRKGIMGVFASSFITNIFSTVLAFVFIRKWLRWPVKYDFKRLKNMLAYGWPFIPASLAFWVVNLSGIYFINGFKDKADVGLYQIGVSLASMLGLVVNAFQQAWAPFAFSIINEPDAKQTYARVFDVYLVIMVLGCVGVAFFGKDVLVLLTQPQYYGAYDVATVLCYSYLFIGLVNIADLGLSITKNTKPLGFIMTISAGLIIILNLTFIPIWGRIGAAIALCISQAITPVYMFYRSQKAYPIPFKLKKGILIVLLSILVSIIGIVYLQQLDQIKGLLLKITFFIFFVGVLFGIYGKSINVMIKDRKNKKS